MLYSIQEASGNVYGIFPVPETQKSPKVLAQELGSELADILKYQGAFAAPLEVRNAGIHEKVDRVVINIDPVVGPVEESIARVHEAVGRLAIAQ